MLPSANLTQNSSYHHVMLSDENVLVSNSHVLSSSHTNSSTPARSYTNFHTSASSYGSSPTSEENLMVQHIRSKDDSNGLESNSHVLSSNYTNSSTPARNFQGVKGFFVVKLH